MTLGMIWTIILRFAIQDISVEGMCCVCGFSACFLVPQNFCLVIKFLFWLHRNICKGRIVTVVSEKDGAIQECQCTELPHKVKYHIWHVLPFSLLHAQASHLKDSFYGPHVYACIYMHVIDTRQTSWIAMHGFLEWKMTFFCLMFLWFRWLIILGNNFNLI